MMNLTDGKTLCCSDTCERKFECSRSCYTNSGTHCVEDYSSFGTGTYTNERCYVEHLCGKLGDYKMFEPVSQNTEIEL